MATPICSCIMHDYFPCFGLHKTVIPQASSSWVFSFLFKNDRYSRTLDSNLATSEIIISSKDSRTFYNTRKNKTRAYD